ncbi:MAG: hypothetical protein PWQ75_1735 [Methanolobus sp.]|nr:hypothetical protein [Methanolobus sp.]
MDITQQFLLNASVLMEIPITLVLLSSMLNYRANRIANSKIQFQIMVKIMTCRIVIFWGYYVQDPTGRKDKRNFNPVVVHDSVFLLIVSHYIYYSIM